MGGGESVGWGEGFSDQWNERDLSATEDERRALKIRCWCLVIQVPTQEDIGLTSGSSMEVGCEGHSGGNPRDHDVVDTKVSCKIILSLSNGSAEQRTYAWQSMYSPKNVVKPYQMIQMQNQ